MPGPAARLRIRVPGELLFLLPAGHRSAAARTAPGGAAGPEDEYEVPVAYDGASSLGHVVESLGVPLTEVGGVWAAGVRYPPRAPAAACRPGDDEVVRVEPVRRPQPLPSGEPVTRFLLDVHLGTLARRLRLLGLDAAYDNDMADEALAARAGAERRVLLTQDRGLLRRRALWFGAYVRGARPADQLRDVLTRFAPPLAPWTRCTACGGRLAAVAKEEVAGSLAPGTLRTYDTFRRCADCGRVYWRGAHGGRLEGVVEEAVRTVAEARRAAR